MSKLERLKPPEHIRQDMLSSTDSKAWLELKKSDRKAWKATSREVQRRLSKIRSVRSLKKASAVDKLRFFLTANGFIHQRSSLRRRNMVYIQNRFDRHEMRAQAREKRKLASGMKPIRGKGVNKNSSWMVVNERNILKLNGRGTGFVPKRYYVVTMKDSRIFKGKDNKEYVKVAFNRWNKDKSAFESVGAGYYLYSDLEEDPTRRPPKLAPKRSRKQKSKPKENFDSEKLNFVKAEKQVEAAAKPKVAVEKLPLRQTVGVKFRKVKENQKDEKGNVIARKAFWEPEHYVLASGEVVLAEFGTSINWKGKRALHHNGQKWKFLNWPKKLDDAAIKKPIPLKVELIED